MNIIRSVLARLELFNTRFNELKKQEMFIKREIVLF